jgi:hypothetical protein
VPKVPHGDAARTGDQAVTLACACEHCGHEFEAELEGGHRLLCGNATSASDLARLMGGDHADICFTSPPYAQQRDYKTGAQDWNALMQGVFSILPVKHGAQVLVNLGLVHQDGEWLPYWDEIPVMVAAGWSEAQKRAYVLADNQLAITGSVTELRFDVTNGRAGHGF